MAELQPDGKYDLKSEALFNHRPNRILNFDNDKVGSIQYYSVEGYMYSRQNFKYDALGRLNEMSFEDGGMITTKTNIYSYNSKGQLVKQADKYDKLIAASHVIYEGDKISKIELRFPNGRVEPSYIYSYDSGTVKERSYYFGELVKTRNLTYNTNGLLTSEIIDTYKNGGQRVTILN